MFQPLSDARSKIRLQVVYAPEGIVESVGDELSMVSRCVQDDLNDLRNSLNNMVARAERGGSGIEGHHTL